MKTSGFHKDKLESDATLIYFFVLIVFLLNGCAGRRADPCLKEETICAYPAPEAATVPLSPSSAYSSRPYSRKVSLSRKPRYLIKRGDSLSKISKKYGVSIKALMKENNIRNPSKIIIGQKLFIPVSTSHPKKARTFLFPVQGEITYYFGEVINKKINKGITIKTKENACVHPSKRGKVVFCDYIRGYGNTVIIEHANNISTVYANLADSSVKRGDSVSQDHLLGHVAVDAKTNVAILHFEVRTGYRAADPLYYMKSYD